MEENPRGREAEDGFATWDEAVAAARDKRIEGYKSMALGVPEESQD